MRFVPNKFRGNYSFDPAMFFEFEELGIKTNGTLCISITDKGFVSKIKGKKFLLNLEEPNCLWAPNLRFPEGTFDRVFSICKFTTIFMKRDQYNSGEYVFFPVNMKYVPESNERPFDLVYSGHLRHKKIIRILQALKEKRLNLCVISDTDHSLVTHKGVNHMEKMKLIASSKLSLVYNQLFVTKMQRYLLEKDFPDYRNNLAFSHFKDQALVNQEDSSLNLPIWLKLPLSIAEFLQEYSPIERDLARYLEGLWSRSEVENAPQLKSRLFESTACGTIPVVISDQWNLVGDWFSDEEYIPTSEESAVETICQALLKYNSLGSLVDHLKEKTRVNYSTIAFADRYLS